MGGNIACTKNYWVGNKMHFLEIGHVHCNRDHYFILARILEKKIIIIHMNCSK